MYDYKPIVECIDGAKGLLTLPDRSIKLIYGSPPYPNADRNYGNWSSEEYIERMTPFLDAAKAKLRDDGFLIINVKANREKATKGCSTRRSLVVEKLAILLEEKWKFYCVDIEIWVKDNPVPTGLRSACQDAYEQILWFSVSPKWKINIDAIRRSYDANSLKAYERNEYKPRTNGVSYVRKIKKIDPNPNGALPLNVIRGSVSSKQSIHQAVQPGYLPEKYIKATTTEGDTVVDPWLGSGTTGYEAIKLTRQFAGFDIQKDYIDYCKTIFGELIDELNMKQKVGSKRKEFHEKLLQHLGNAVAYHSDVDYRPLYVSLIKPIKIDLTIYLFTNTNPSGGRSANEYKFNLTVPGQERGMRGDFDNTNGIPILMSYTEEYDVYILYDAEKHRNFMYNANIQSKQELILEALSKPFATYKKKNDEILIAVTGKNLIKGIEQRIRI